MLVDKDRFAPDLLENVSPLPLSAFRHLNQSATIVQSLLQTHARSWFHQMDFQKWREGNFKEYLKAKRKEEKEKRQYAKPYTEYLDQIEKQMFKVFWDEHRLSLMHFFIQGALETQGSPYLAQILKLKEEHPEVGDTRIKSKMRLRLYLKKNR